MDVAYTVWTWHLDPFNSFQKSEDPAQQRVEFEKGLREIQYLGYTAVCRKEIDLIAIQDGIVKMWVYA